MKKIIFLLLLISGFAKAQNPVLAKYVDFSTINAADSSILKNGRFYWNGSKLRFIQGGTRSTVWPASGSGGSTTLAALTDVSLTGLAANDFLKYDGADWINRTPAQVLSDIGAQATGLSWLLASGGTSAGTNTWNLNHPWVQNFNVTTGTGATAGINGVFNSLTTGRGVEYSTTTVSSGTLSYLASTSTAINHTQGTNALSSVVMSGVNANVGRTAVGFFSSVTNTNVTSGTNIAGYFRATGATTANYAGIFDGSVGIGVGAPQTLLQVGIGGTASGATSPLYVTGSNSGRISIEVQNANGAGNSSFYFQNNRGSFASYGGLLHGGSTYSATLFGVASADRTLLLSDGANTAGLGMGTLTATPVFIGTNGAIRLNVSSTGLFTFSPTTLGAGTGVDISAVTTDAASNTQKLLNVALSGANATSTQTTYTTYFLNTKTGTSSRNIAVRAASGSGTENYAFYAEGGSNFFANGGGLSPINNTSIIQIHSGAGGNATGLLIKSTTSANYSEISLFNDNNDQGQLFLTGSTYSTATAIRASGLGFYNSGTGGISIVAGHASGSITFAIGGTSSSSNRLTISSAGLVTIPGGINLSGASSPLQVGGSAGTSGQVLTSAGAGATPTWGTIGGTLSGLTTNRMVYATSATSLGNTELSYTFSSDIIDFFSSTSDGSDSHAVRIAAGGSVSSTRGGYITLSGNEASSGAGGVSLISGVSGFVSFNSGANTNLAISSAMALEARNQTALTNTVSYPLKISHTTSGTGATGFGAGVQFEIETTVGNNEIVALVEAVSTDVTGASEDVDLVFKNMTAGAAATEKLRITSTGNLYGTALHNNSVAPTGTVNQYITSGTHTPTVASFTNVAASTAYECHWTRVGNEVTFMGTVDIDPTAPGLTQLSITLDDIPSNFAATTDAAGTAVTAEVAGHSGVISANVANDYILLEFTAVDVSNRKWQFSCKYEVK